MDAETIRSDVFEGVSGSGSYVARVIQFVCGVLHREYRNVFSVSSQDPPQFISPTSCFLVRTSRRSIISQWKGIRKSVIC